MALYFRKKILLAKIETTYGTDPTPTATTNAILTKDLSIGLMQGDTVERGTDRTTLGGELTYHVNPYTTVSFSVELAGAGAAGTVPGYGPLLKACGMYETINTGTSVVYAPTSSSFSSVTLYYYWDGLLHEVNGARGNVTFSLSPGGIPMMNYTFTGKRVAQVDVALPTPTLTGFKTPTPVTVDNTPTITLQGTTLVCGSLNFDLGNQVVYRKVFGDTPEAVVIVNRKVTGDISFEEALKATKDWHTAIAGHTTGALQFIHLTAAGYICQVDAPCVQILSPTYAEQDGMLMLQAKLNCIPNAGNDEFTLTVK